MLERLNVVFSYIKDSGFLETNPVYQAGIAKLRSQQTGNDHFTKEEINQLREAILDRDQDRLLWDFIAFMYYGFMRPTEIRMIQVKHLYWKNKSLMVPSETSQKRKHDHVIKMGETLSEICQRRSKNLSKNDYLFFLDISEKPIGKNTLSRKFWYYLRELGLEKDHVFYNWKHTGVYFTYKETKDIKAIQERCGHSDISDTISYLKKLDALDQSNFVASIPAYV